MLATRSAQESHLYMELHPCECGEVRFEWAEHRLTEREDGFGSNYIGKCPGCGRERTFEFVEDASDAALQPGFGGPEPSTIIDPGEFLAVSRQAADAIPADPAKLTDETLRDAHEILEFAAQALDEVLKFIPEGEDVVPAEAFRSDLGRRLYQHDPEQFTRQRLEAARAVFAELLDAYARR